MNHLPQTALFALVTGLAAPLSAQQGGMPALEAPGSPACEAMADAVLTAACSEAEADFWLHVALLMNGNAADLRSGLREAWQDRNEALALAAYQHAARLAVCATLGHGPYDPRVRPHEFTAQVDNAFHPLPIGRTYVYERMTAEGLEHIETTALNEDTMIAHVPCRAVRTEERLNGELIELTVDWYSQHADGSVWYFGELAQDFAEGMLVSIDGSWRTGRDGALPGILMLNAPQTGEAYRMEFLLNQAEDVARVVAVNQTVVVAAGTFHGCVAIEETSALEPDDVAVKFYARDVGMVLEIDQQTGERLELIQIK
jgi:hypothetical protein